MAALLSPMKAELARSLPFNAAHTHAVNNHKSKGEARAAVSKNLRGADIQQWNGLRIKALKGQRAWASPGASCRTDRAQSPQIQCALATEVAKEVNIGALEQELQAASPFAIMDKALEAYGDDIAVSFSGAEDVALIEYAKLTGRPFRVFSLDTGRLHPETYQLFEKVEKHYGIRIEYMFPEAAAVEALVREKGMFSFYADGHQECCGIRKVQPLKRKLRTLRAWITGQRKDQSPGTRSRVPVLQVDPAFEGERGGPGSLVKFNPLAEVSSAQVWDFLRAQEVPVNALHARGFTSIGCEPCTRPVLPGQHEREGRWWWEDSTAKECGLHKASGGAAAELSQDAEGAHVSGTDGDASESTLRDLYQDANVAALTRPQIEELALSDRPREESWLVVLYAPWCPFCQAMEDAYDEVARQLAGTGVRVGKFQADREHKDFSREHLQLKSFPTILFMPRGGTQVIKRLSERRSADSLLTWVDALK
eukprot:jgi/Mesen1/1358/ME000013S00848